MFLKGLIKIPYIFAIIGFVTGMFFALIMPPVIIAIVEGILLALLCFCILCK